MKEIRYNIIDERRQKQGSAIASATLDFAKANVVSNVCTLCFLYNISLYTLLIELSMNNMD